MVVSAVGSRSWAASLHRRPVDPASHRSWALAANDGIIATAGVLQGFAGAGAGTRLLLFSATAATIAGGFTTGGVKWAETSAEREAQQAIVRQEQEAIERDPQGEEDELVSFWKAKGLSADLARRVASELSAKDALAAQLEWEYDFDEPMSRGEPLWTGVSTGSAYVVGALVPLLITYFAPLDIETWAILLAVLIALGLTSWVAARAGQVQPRKMLARSVTVGVFTLGVSYVAGELLL